MSGGGFVRGRRQLGRWRGSGVCDRDGCDEMEYGRGMHVC